MSGAEVFQLDQDLGRYEMLLSRMESRTVYHAPAYLLAEQAAEPSPVQIFVYESDGRVGVLPFIQREVGRVAGLEAFAGCYDLKTPHEYAGALASSADDAFLAELYRALAAYCEEHRIVFGFLRCNPYRRDAVALAAAGYTLHRSGEQVSIDVTQGDEAVFAGFSASVRRNVRLAARRGVVSQPVTPTAEHIAQFFALYEETMRRLAAKPFFFFNKTYFERLLTSPLATLFFAQRGDELLAASILIYDDTTAYYHLSGSVAEARRDKPVESLLAAMAMWAHARGLTRLHLGGGGGSLSAFKERFSPLRVPYDIAWRVFDAARYQEICETYLRLHPEEQDSSFQPLYRSKE